jgi:hypothetical protein
MCRVSKSISGTPYCLGMHSTGFLKYLYISDPHKFASKYLTCLFQDRDVILTVGFQYSPVIEDLVLLILMPGLKFGSFTDAHLFSP